MTPCRPSMAGWLSFRAGTPHPPVRAWYPGNSGVARDEVLTLTRAGQGNRGGSGNTAGAGPDGRAATTPDRGPGLAGTTRRPAEPA